MLVVPKLVSLTLTVFAVPLMAMFHQFPMRGCCLRWGVGRHHTLSWQRSPLQLLWFGATDAVVQLNHPFTRGCVDAADDLVLIQRAATGQAVSCPSRCGNSWWPSKR